MRPTRRRTPLAVRPGLVTITDVAQESTCRCVSVAVHLTAVVPTEKDDPERGTQLVLTGATPPVIVGLKSTFTGLRLCDSNGAMSGHEIESGGIVGACAGGNTIAADVHEARRLLPSTALQLNVVTPTGNSEPDEGTQIDETGAVPPETVGANVRTTRLPRGEVADGAGQMMAGGAAGAGGVYVTTTDVLHDVLNRRASVAVHVAGVEPTGKSEPDAGVHDALTGAVPPETAGEKATTTGLRVVDEATGVGHWMTGRALGVPDVKPDTSNDGRLMVPAES